MGDRKHRFLPLLALFLLAGCETPRSLIVDRRRMEARLAKVNADLERLEARLAALEGRPLGRPAAEPAATPPARRPGSVEFPFPVGESPPPEPALPEGAGSVNPLSPTAAAGWTGLVLDARRAKSIRGPAPVGSRHPLWRVLDPKGDTIFKSEEIPATKRRILPLFWLRETRSKLDPSLSPLIGRRPLVLTVDYAETYEHEDGKPETLLYVSGKVAARLRSLEDLPDLVDAGALAVLLLKR